MTQLLLKNKYNVFRAEAVVSIHIQQAGKEHVLRTCCSAVVCHLSLINSRMWLSTKLSSSKNIITRDYVIIILFGNILS